MKTSFWLKIAPGNTKKIVPISTQKYKDEAYMEEYVLDIPSKIENVMKINDDNSS